MSVVNLCLEKEDDDVFIVWCDDTDFNDNRFMLEINGREQIGVYMIYYGTDPIDNITNFKVVHDDFSGNSVDELGLISEIDDINLRNMIINKMKKELIKLNL